MMRGNHIALFAGVEMTGIAAEAFGFKTIATAECDPWNRKVLQRRHPNAYHLSDVVHVTPRMVGPIRRPLLVSGGFPCQDVSSAGTGLGLAGSRSGLWREFDRVIGEFGPEYVLIENSPMLRNRGLNTVLRDLDRRGYDAWWDCIPAAAVGAPHLRDRIFILAVKRPLKFQPGGATVTRKIADNDAEWPDRLPRAGALISGMLWELTPQAKIKDAKRAILAHAVKCPATPTGAWPTPAASNPQDGESAESWLARRETLRAKGINGNGAGMPLNIAVKLFPTPTKSDGSGGPGTTPKRTGGKNLRTVVAESDGNGRLNPAWVEWMMGLPIGWTDPELSNDQLRPHPGWGTEGGIPRTVAKNEKDRAKRIRALGNGLVPQAAMVALGWAL
jgi:site-specific DNA-cytosine methylase